MNARELLTLALDQGVLIFLQGDKLVYKARANALSQSLRQQIQDHRASVIKLLSEDRALRKPLIAAKPKIQRLHLQRAELSYAQQRIWFIDQLEGGSAQYNMSAAFLVDGEFDLNVAQQALSDIVKRHEILRTVYCQDNGHSWQQVMPAEPFVITQQCLQADAQQQALPQLLAENAAKQFDLSKDLMLRVSFIQVASAQQLAQQILFFNMHHIAFDGWSSEILIKEFEQFYRAGKEGKQAQLATLDIQYSDYATWQRNWLSSQVLAEHRSYWQSQLADIPSLHSLIPDKPRPKAKQHYGNRITSKWSAPLADTFSQAAKSLGLTDFMLLHGALALMLSRHSNNNDIVIGTPVANRMQRELAPLIGFFVNTIALRVDTKQSSVESYWAHIKQVNLDGLAHQDMPFDLLLETISVERSSAYSPVFQIMLTINNQFGQLQQRGFSLTDVEIQPLAIDAVLTKFDIELEVTLDNTGMTFNWIYDVNLFEPERIVRFDCHFKRLLQAMIEQQAVELKALPMLSDEELRAMLFDYNERQWPLVRQPIHRLFEQQAAKTPDSIALIFEQQSISYKALNAAANRVADELVNQGVGPDCIVGLAFERSLEMVVAMLAILKANGAYLPLDSELPQSRLMYMCEDAGVEHLLIQTHLASLYPVDQGIKITIVDLVQLEQQFSHRSATNLPTTPAQKMSNLCYTIYTSGSTGKPKGVLLEHLSVVNRLDWMLRNFPLNRDDKVLHKTPFNFDVSVWEIFWPLLSGAALVIARPGGHKDPQYISDLVAEQQINALHFVPSMLSVFLSVPNARFADSVRHVFCSGEALEVKDVKAVQQLPNVTLHNLYGPTEGSIEVTYFDCSALKDETFVPIGKPLDNIKVYVLDSDLNCSPSGCVGELYIAGVAVARGYMNNPALNEQYFLADPFASDPNARMYKTGDLVKVAADGNIIYMGRADNQIKIRGYRIELGEIENHLSLCPEVVVCTVIVDENHAGIKQLIGYLVLSDTANTDEQAAIAHIKRQLSHSLPDYMVPAAFVVIEQLPLTSSGKVDRKALPKAQSILSERVYRPPTTECQRRLVDIWATLFMIDNDKISIDVGFFDLGGHSLLAVKCVAQINEQFGINVALKEVFEKLTIEQLSAVIEMELSVKALQQQQLNAVITEEGVL